MRPELCEFCFKTHECNKNKIERHSCRTWYNGYSFWAAFRFNIWKFFDMLLRPIKVPPKWFLKKQVQSSARKVKT